MERIKFQSIVKSRIYVAPIPKGRVLPVPYVFTNTKKVSAGSDIMTLALASIDGHEPGNAIVELEHDQPILFPVNPHSPRVNDLIRLDLDVNTQFVSVGSIGKTVTVFGINHDMDDGVMSLDTYIFRQLLGMEKIEINRNNEGINLSVEGVCMPSDKAQEQICASRPLYVRFDSPGMGFEGISTVTGTNDRLKSSGLSIYKYNFTISKVTAPL